MYSGEFVAQGMMEIQDQVGNSTWSFTTIVCEMQELLLCF
jgi:hypothetical protein